MSILSELKLLKNKKKEKKEVDLREISQTKEISQTM